MKNSEIAFSPKWTKVSENSPEYQEHLEHNRTLATDINEKHQHKIFGEEEISYIDILSAGDLPSFNRLPEYMEQRAKKAVPNIKSKITKYLSDDTEGTKIQALQEELDEFGNISGLNIDAGELAVQPDEVVESFVRFHIKKFREGQETLEAELEKYRQEFIEEAVIQVRQGKLPIDEKTLRRRATGVGINAYDFLNGVLKEAGGEYFAEGGQFGEPLIYITEQASQDKQYKILCHEMFHALSGRTIIGRPNIYISFEDQPEETHVGSHYHNQRIGLELQGRFDGPTSFHWLNEAVTEATTMELLGNKSGTYYIERLVLEVIEDIMKAGGVDDPRKLFLDAYFEDYEPGETSRIPAWKKLNKAINQAFSVRGGSWLTIFNKIVEEEGIAGAALNLRSWAKDNNIPAVESRFEAKISEINQLIKNLGGE